MTTTMTTQAIVNDLAARTKPCPSCKGYRIDKGGSEGPCFMCKGTGTVPAFPWLWEECRGLWVDFQREKVHKSSPYYGCCDGSGQRVRRVETVHLEEIANSFYDSLVPLYTVIADAVACQAHPEKLVEAALRAIHAAVTGHDPA